MIATVLTFRAETDGEKIARERGQMPVATFLVIQTSGRTGEAYIAETLLPGLSSTELARGLLNWDDAERILFIDEAAGICRDASKEIAAAIVKGAEENGGGVHYLVAGFCERHGVAIPASLRRTA